MILDNERFQNLVFAYWPWFLRVMCLFVLAIPVVLLVAALCGVKLK